jgi:hypothetical protein
VRFRSCVAYLRRSTDIRIININGKKRPKTQNNVIENGQERIVKNSRVHVHAPKTKELLSKKQVFFELYKKSNI